MLMFTITTLNRLVILDSMHQLNSVMESLSG